MRCVGTLKRPLQPHFSSRFPASASPPQTRRTSPVTWNHHCHVTLPRSFRPFTSTTTTFSASPPPTTIISDSGASFPLSEAVSPQALPVEQALADNDLAEASHLYTNMANPHLLADQDLLEKLFFGCFEMREFQVCVHLFYRLLDEFDAVDIEVWESMIHVFSHQQRPLDASYAFEFLVSKGVDNFDAHLNYVEHLLATHQPVAAERIWDQFFIKFINVSFSSEVMEHAIKHRATPEVFAFLLSQLPQAENPGTVLLHQMAQIYLSRERDRNEILESVRKVDLPHSPFMNFALLQSYANCGDFDGIVRQLESFDEWRSAPQHVAQMIRGLIMSNFPKMAFSILQFLKNVSPLHTEIEETFFAEIVRRFPAQGHVYYRRWMAENEGLLSPLSRTSILKGLLELGQYQEAIVIFHAFEKEEVTSASMSYILRYFISKGQLKKASEFIVKFHYPLRSYMLIPTMEMLSLVRSLLLRENFFLALGLRRYFTKAKLLLPPLALQYFAYDDHYLNHDKSMEDVGAVQEEHWDWLVETVIDLKQAYPMLYFTHVRLWGLGVMMVRELAKRGHDIQQIALQETLPPGRYNNGLFAYNLTRSLETIPYIVLTQPYFRWLFKAVLESGDSSIASNSYDYIVNSVYGQSGDIHPDDMGALLELMSKPSSYRLPRVRPGAEEGEGRGEEEREE